MAGPGPDDPRGRQRMLDDAAMIRATERWPTTELHVKTQPWVTSAAGFRSGVIRRESPTTVHVRNADPEHYDALETLVRTWSVD